MRAMRAAILLAATLTPTVTASGAGPSDWQGFHAGLNIGHAWGRSDAAANSSVGCGTVFPLLLGCENSAGVDAAGTGWLSSGGITAGVQAGYDWQHQTIVVGTALDFGAFDLSRARTATGAYTAGAPGTPYTTTTAVDADWLLTVRGRLGWTPVPNALLYATGANAFTDANDFGPGTVSTGAASASQTKFGWTVGGGGEWLIDAHWSLGIEYLFLDFGAVSATAIVNQPAFAVAQSVLTTSSDLTAHDVRVGLNYRY